MDLKVHQDDAKLAKSLEWRNVISFVKIDTNIDLIVQLREILETL